MQAIFLGEKSAIFGDSFVISNFGDQLKKFGYILDGDWIYDPEQIQQIIDEYHDILIDGLKSPKAIIDFLNNEVKSKHHLIRGLCLGYPFSSVCEFSYRSREKLNISDTISTGAYGINWTDYGQSEQDS